MKIVMSSGHGKYIRGASGYLDEVDEARRVVEQTATVLRGMGVEVITFHDDVSDDQSENLNRIVNFHNSKTRDLDVSVHFNAYQTTSKPMGTEVLYVSSSGQKVADTTVDTICSAVPFINRGPKKRTDLAFLNGTEETAVLIETCFVDSKADADLYNSRFNDVCAAIASGLTGEEVGPSPIPPPEPSEGLFYAKGKCSHFGGPNDSGVSPSEGLAFISSIEQQPWLFLPGQPANTTGLARRLNPYVSYVACRWDYNVTSREMLRANKALIRANGWEILAFPADWGPNENTGRVADLSPSLMEALGLTTDDEVEVIFPYEGD